MRRNRLKRQVDCCARDLCDNEAQPLTQEFPAQIIGAQRARFRLSPLRVSTPASFATLGHGEKRHVDHAKETARKCYDTVKTSPAIAERAE
jgi:hypothetical protein